MFSRLRDSIASKMEERRKEAEELKAWKKKMMKEERLKFEKAKIIAEREYEVEKYKRRLEQGHPLARAALGLGKLAVQGVIAANKTPKSNVPTKPRKRSKKK